MNDDMDELFKSAAENYPLNTNGADWDKVMQQLHPADEDAPVAPKKKDNTKFLWLLLLLPFVFICNRYTGSDDVSLNNKNNVPQQEVVKDKMPVLNKKDIADNRKAAVKQPAGPVKTETGKTNIVQENKKGHQLTSSIYRSHHMSTEPINRRAYAKVNSTINNSKELSNNKTNDVNDNKVSDIYNDDRYNDKDVTHKKNDIAASVDNGHNKIDNLSINDSITHKEVATTTNSDSSKSETTKPITVKSKNNKKGFYAGITFGPDYSTIKFQQIQKSGYSVGILAGYQLNNHWAVETGGLWDKKNYYSEGAYFNTKKITIPNNVKIIDVSGTCYMIEIPVNIKYTISNGAKGNWFVMAGTSSYLMKKEDYTYLYDHNSSVYDVYKAYKNSTRNWFSIMNISAGYERTLSNIATIRIEPYIKIPINGVGIGSLPITSTGIYISVTRPVFK